MRQSLYGTIFFILVSFTALKAQQIMVEGETKAHQVEYRPQIKETQVEPSDLIHRYLCRRCGSENQMDWAFPMNKELELIPHCSFCGKKYWPKFKPTGLLERTYCLNSESLISRLRQH
jgi:hypothetical protein